jgi:hypothetical protein
MVWRTRQLQDDRLTTMAHDLPAPGAETSAAARAGITGLAGEKAQAINFSASRSWCFQPRCAAKSSL